MSTRVSPAARLEVENRHRSTVCQDLLTGKRLGIGTRVRWRTFGQIYRSRGAVMGDVIHIGQRLADQAFDAALMNLAKARTVSIPGDLVSPDCTLRSVWKGTPDNLANRCSCDGASEASAARTSSGLGTVRFIEPDPTDSGRSCLPLSVGPSEYPTGMAGDPTKAIVIANIELLMKQKFERINVTGFGKFTGISTGGTQRVLDPDTSVSVDILGRIAAKFGLETWQLLAPNLGQALLLSPAELEAVRKIREPQQPKTIKTEHIETKQIASPLSGHGARKKNKVGV